MIHVVMPDTMTRRLPFFLAAEEFVARELPSQEYFFVWQVEPTVICGRNQRIDVEVDLDYCAKNGIDVCRRRSGGGCVYADRNNLMFSYITPSEEVSTTFYRYTTMIASMLQSLGLNAQATGRNDILIDGRKVSGNAFYHIPGRSIVHGTMLYDTDLQHMLRAITPSRSKLESKQVQSVESRITTLNRHLNISIDDFRRYAIRHLTKSKITLSDDDIHEIELIEQNYYQPGWLYGHNRRNSITKECHEEGVGQISVNINLNNDRISDISLSGDFFTLCEPESRLFGKILGKRLDSRELHEALAETDCRKIIAGLSTGRFIELITDQNDIS